jgi:hypothetical protein
MAEPDTAAVLKRAKELCEQDGYVWEREFTSRRGTRLKGQIFPSQERRRLYIARAQTDLLKKAGDA